MTNTSVSHPELDEAADLLRAGKLTEARNLAQNFLKRYPANISGMRVLADIEVKLGRFDDAGHLLQHCLQLAPDFHVVRQNYVVVLIQQQKLDRATEEIEKLLAREPDNPNLLILKGSILVRGGNHPAAIDIYERVLKDHPDVSRARMNLGHSLKAVGRLDEAIQAYRKCIESGPGIGQAYWNLANLKTFKFSDADIALMRARVASGGGNPEDKARIAFALGKALEDRHQFDESFHSYQQGNTIWRIKHRHNARVNEFNTARQIKTLDKAFFDARQGYGCKAPDPIFVVGLPRAGSTLLEQILASHSQVEGTGELADIMMMSRELGQISPQNPASKYPEILTSLSAEQCRESGEAYIRATRTQGRDSAYFIDKMPNNFQHIGLIHLILPNARIIDARRHPMACCFSGFKQLFASGQTFTYDLSDLGRYYRAYVMLMDHWERVLPGRVLRVQYEDMVTDTENQVRRMLDYCGLGFEEQCLRFHETRRAIRTPSAEQVRQPIYTQGLAQWRHFEAHLGPLKEALGAVLDRYPID